MQPEIQSCSWLFEAFRDLSTCRQIGMGVGPIPLTAIQDYSDRHGLGDLFVRQILQIDRQYVTDQNADTKQSATHE